MKEKPPSSIVSKSSRALNNPGEIHARTTFENLPMSVFAFSRTREQTDFISLDPLAPSAFLPAAGLGPRLTATAPRKAHSIQCLSRSTLTRSMDIHRQKKRKPISKVPRITSSAGTGPVLCVFTAIFLGPQHTAGFFKCQAKVKGATMHGAE